MTDIPVGRYVLGLAYHLLGVVCFLVYGLSQHSPLALAAGLVLLLGTAVVARVLHPMRHPSRPLSALPDDSAPAAGQLS